MAKPVIRWKASAQDNALAGKTIYVPTVVDRTDPVDLATLVERAIDTDRIAGLKPSAAQGIAEATCEMIAQVLSEGEGVKFSDYFTVRMYLSGTVDGPLASLTEKNQINAKIITGSKLKIDRSQFSFRNINDTGDAPYIDEVQSDVDGAINSVVEVGKNLAVIGSNLELGENDEVTVWRQWYGATPGVRVVGTITAADCTTNSNKLIRFPWSALSGGAEIQVGDLLHFEVTKQVELPTGQTGTQTSNRFTATAVEATPEPTPVTPTSLAAAMKSDGGVPGVVEPNSRVMIIGTALKLASGGTDKLKVAWYSDSAHTEGTPTGTCEVAAGSLVSNEDAYLTFNWSTIGDPLDHPTVGTLRFSVLKGGVESNSVDAVVSAE